MKPIIVLAVMAIAITGLGVGSLGNEITLTVQDIGVGDETIVSPIDAATVRFNIDKIPGNQNNFKNVIAECKVFADEIIKADSIVFCKLTDENGFVAAEGQTVVSIDIPIHTPFTVGIDDPQKMGSQVQNVHDVVLVVQGPPKGPAP